MNLASPFDCCAPDSRSPRYPARRALRGPEPTSPACTPEGEPPLVRPCTAFFAPVSDSARRGPRIAGVRRLHLGHEVDLLTALEAMHESRLSFERISGRDWPGNRLLSSTPHIDIAGGRHRHPRVQDPQRGSSTWPWPSPPVTSPSASLSWCARAAEGRLFVLIRQALQGAIHDMVANKRGDTVDASPTKAFFVNMITRDITLEDTILDLIDNSVDAAWHSEGGRGMELADSVDLSAYQISIFASPERFSIRDNCGGMTLDDAVEHAFSFGRRASQELEEYSIGVYGIGMKRAVFQTWHGHTDTEHLYET